MNSSLNQPARQAEQELRQLREAATQRAVLLLDDDARLLACAGELAHFGLDSLSSGDDTRECLPLLYQRRELAGDYLAFVQLPNGVVADIAIEQRDQYLLAALTATTEQHRVLQRQQQKANELALLQREQNITLSALREAHRQLREQRDELESLSQAQRHTMNCLAHEVRNPLQAMLASLEGGQEADATEYTGRMRRSVWQLLTLVENLLADGQQTATSDSRQAAEPAQLAEDCVQLLRPSAIARGLCLELDCPAELQGRSLLLDEYRVRQILFNLIGNAIRYTTQGGISVRVRVDKNQLSIQVIDTGPGIDAGDQARLFSAYQRGGASGGNHGAGLGLSISRELAEDMGGSLTLDSKPGEGSTFTLTLPAVEAEKQAMSPQAQPEDAQLTGSVLVVDDDPDVREAVSAWLRGWGLAVSTCRNLAELFEKLHTTAPQWLILDQNLPDGQGTDVLGRVAEHWTDCRVVLLSGERVQVDAGACVLRKPVSQRMLYRTLMEDA